MNIEILVHIGLLYFLKKNEIVYFDSFGVEHTPEEIKNFIGNRNIKANVFRVQANNSIMCDYFCIGFIDFILAGKTLIDYTNLFSPQDFDKNDQIIISYFKDAWIDKTKLPDQTKFRLYEIKKIENCFINDINERESYSKKLNKYVTIFDYIDKTLIVLRATSGGISIVSFTTTTGAPVGIASASFTSVFSITTGIIKNLLSTTIRKKKEHDQILVLAKSKYNSIEALISQALNDLNIIHKEFIMILKEKDRYEKMKYNLISENGDEKQETIKLSSI